MSASNDVASSFAVGLLIGFVITTLLLSNILFGGYEADLFNEAGRYNIHVTGFAGRYWYWDDDKKISIKTNYDGIRALVKAKEEGR